MANSDLKNRRWKIPKKHKQRLVNNLKQNSDKKEVEGFVRIKNFVKKGFMTYSDLKNLKHVLDKNQKNKTVYELNGGKIFHDWVNDSLNLARKRIKDNKKLRKDNGEENVYIKNHEKDSSRNITKIKNPKISKSSKSKDIYNNNVNYESVKNIKIMIAEDLYNELNNIYS